MSVKAFAAKLFAKRIHAKTQKWASNPIETQQKVRLLKLLRLPRGEEMGDEPSGQPRLGQYPSDHFALMSEIEIL